VQMTIGLEVHVQLQTETKLFSPARHEALAAPNTHVDVIDLGLPGVLPQPNALAIRLATRAALALGGPVQEFSIFARKHYFYPDLPKGYQISQYEEPYCQGGAVPLDDGTSWPLTRIHLEEDAGKLTHTDVGTLVDLNRAGAPLIEIVSTAQQFTPEVGLGLRIIGGQSRFKVNETLSSGQLIGRQPRVPLQPVAAGSIAVGELPVKFNGPLGISRKSVRALFVTPGQFFERLSMAVVRGLFQQSAGLRRVSLQLQRRIDNQVGPSEFKLGFGMVVSGRRVQPIGDAAG